ncbi:GDSL-type esterase/lipase family protein [Actinoplanes sp. NPDC089786]|uniref:GDSL-type esterase/lipase family protein n=1 Tax=Actinoplanes sp. NPDC089786 TaxID=3155185 RepID=UPI0034330998
MRTVIRILVATLVAASALLAPSPAPAAVITGRPVKIMPLGDSITWGDGSSTTSSYRAALWQRLVGGAGLAVDYVGSGQSGSLPDPDNEGHSGWRIEQITASIDGWLATSRPDVVLLHIGTNDLNQNFDVANAPARLGTLLDRIHTGAPDAVVLVAQIVPALDATINSRITTFNAAVPSVLSSRAAYTRLVDLNRTITTADLNDTLHPNDAGYTKMADLWHAALESVLGGGRDWPLLRAGLEPGETAPTWTDTVDGSQNVGGYNAALTTMETGPRAETSRGGANALMYSGNDLSATGSYSYMRVLDTHLRIGATSVLTYWIFPQQTNGAHVAVDLAFTDGSSLRDSGATDQYGVRAHPQFQGEGGHLVVNQWNLVRVSLSALAGRTVDRVHLGYDQPAGTGVFRGYVDDLAITGTTRPAAVNLALKRPSSASSACATTEDATRANDGTTGNNSKWCTGVSGATWQTDLGAATTVRTVIVRHASTGGEPLAWNTRAYRIQLSPDATTWTTFATVTNNADGVVTSTAGPSTARHVRLLIDTGQQDGAATARIFEVEVYTT